MEAALASHATDIIGMARPLTAEPTLPELLAAHKDAKAKENLVFLPLQTASSIQQIGQVSFDTPSLCLRS
jgi:2,4-dienoyl-CoA reductase-like NADH-dependent reductase (Old Yellow Enzyme family)